MTVVFLLCSICLWCTSVSIGPGWEYVGGDADKGIRDGQMLETIVFRRAFRSDEPIVAPNTCAHEAMFIRPAGIGR